LNFTGWSSHLRGFATDDIVEYIRKPVEGQATEKEREGDDVESQPEEEDSQEGVQYENKSAIAIRGTRRLIRSAFRTSSQSQGQRRVGKPALEYINRQESGEKDNERPLHARQKVNTIRKSTQHWIQMLCYLWRTQSNEEAAVYIHTAAERRFEQGKRISRSEVKSRNDEWEGEFESAILKIWIAMFDQRLKDDQYVSGVMSSIAVLAIDQLHGGWKPAIHFTPVLSAIVTTARALVVHRAWSEQQEEIRDTRESIRCCEDEARDEAQSIYMRVRNMVDEFRVLATFRGEPKPMVRILRMRTYGMKIRYTTLAEGSICWNGDEIISGNINFTMDQLPTAVQGGMKRSTCSCYRRFYY